MSVPMHDSRKGDASGSPYRIAGLTAVLTALAVAILAAPSPAAAQYFGQNKVRYTSMDYKVLATEHFDIHFYEEKRDAAFEVGRMAERWHTRLSAVFGEPLSSRQTIVLYASHPDFRGTTVVSSDIGETTGGLTEGLKRRIVMPLAGPLADTDHVLGHELVHAFQFDIIDRLGKQNGGGRAAFNLPLWFMEGMAEYLSIGPVDAHTAVWLRDAVTRDALPDLARLDDPRYFPYRWGHAFWAHVAGRYGDGVVRPLLTAAAASGSPATALTSVLNVETKALSEEWHTALRARFAGDASRANATQMTRLLESPKAARLNVGPAISPDGTMVAFYSERDGLAIDLFVADATTGEIRRKLTELAIDPHTDSLQFVNAAGAWSADSRRLAYVGVAQGRPQLTISDVATGRIERRLQLHELGDVFSASWSPDNTTIVVSAMAGGYMDLFYVDIESGAVTRLTNDAYTELQPAWSADGRSIVYATDRFTTDLSALTFGPLRLAVIDTATRAVRPLPAFETGKHLNPHWSAHGRAVTFIADPDGIPDVYRLMLDDGRIERVTSVASGVAGIAQNSPALSVASTGRLVVAVHESGGYQLYVTEPPLEPVAAAPLTPSRADNASRLLAKTPNLFGTTSDRLADRATFEVRDYRPRLSLEAIAPLQAGVGVGQLGPFVSGGTAATFADVLGYHRVTVGLQGSSFVGAGGASGLSFVGGYQNERRRWSWGITGGQFSYPAGGSASVVDFYGDQPALLEQEITTREVSREITGVFTRPFSRARRIELAAGYENLSFSAESRFRATALFTGRPLADERITLPTPDGLHMATTHAALVHDTSVFGGTSPIAGERYRLQAGLSTGSADYFTVLADYRRYAPLGGPLTLAGRLMHYGRYGADAEDPRMGELFIGYPHLIRGYDTDTLATECIASGGTACLGPERLLGSRIAVANLELRTSISGYRGLISGLALPIEAALFVDAGTPWSSRRFEETRGRSRTWLTSVGGTLRFNMFGSAVGQVSYVYAANRATPGWRWQFSLAPGF